MGVTLLSVKLSGQPEEGLEVLLGIDVRQFRLIVDRFRLGHLVSGDILGMEDVLGLLDDGTHTLPVVRSKAQLGVILGGPRIDEIIERGEAAIGQRVEKLRRQVEERVDAHCSDSPPQGL
jgi:hypothetical protein